MVIDRVITSRIEPRPVTTTATLRVILPGLNVHADPEGSVAGNRVRRNGIFRTLDGRLPSINGYPPDKQPEAIKLVMEQMESMAPRYALERG